MNICIILYLCSSNCTCATIYCVPVLWFLICLKLWSRISRCPWHTPRSTNFRMKTPHQSALDCLGSTKLPLRNRCAADAQPPKLILPLPATPKVSSEARLWPEALLRGGDGVGQVFEPRTLRRRAAPPPSPSRGVRVGRRALLRGVVKGKHRRRESRKKGGGMFRCEAGVNRSF